MQRLAWVCWRAFAREGWAAAAGVEVGAVMESVAGHDVRGPKRYLYRPLTRVEVGAEVVFGLADRSTVTLTAVEER